MKILAPLILAGGVFSFAKAGLAEGFTFQYFCKGDAYREIAEGPLASAETVESSKQLVKWLKTYVGYDNCDQAQTELEKLTELDLTGFDANDLSPLSSLKNLTHITLGGAKVSSLAPLAALSKLESVTVTDSQVGSLNYFSLLPALKSLALRSSILPSLNGLSSQTLTQLLIDSPVLSSISGVGGAPKMESLQLLGGQIAVITELAQVRSTLKTLWISSDRISDFSPVEQLKNLEEIWLSSSSIQDIGILSDLPNLRSVTLANSGITSLTKLSEFDAKSEITSFQIAYAPLASADGLEYLPALKSLALRGTKIKDMRFLGALPKLTQLDLSENEFSDVTPLESQLSLSSLHLSSSKLQNIDVLENFKSLQDLDLSYNNISSLSALKNARLLNTFAATGNAISNADGIAGAVGMTYLNLSQNPLQGNLPFLDQMQNLNYLALSNTGISNGTRFPALKKLATLDVSENPVSTVDNMVYLENLETIDTTRTSITSFYPFTIPGVSGERNTLRWLSNIISDVSPEITKKGILQGAQIVEIRSEASRMTDIISLRDQVYTDVSTKDQIAGSREARCLAVYSHFTFQKGLVESLKGIARDQGLEISDLSSIFESPCNRLSGDAAIACNSDPLRAEYGQSLSDCANVKTLLSKDNFYETPEGVLMTTSIHKSDEDILFGADVDMNIQLAATTLFSGADSVSLNFDSSRQAFEAAKSIAKNLSSQNPISTIKATFKQQLESSLKEGDALLIKLRKMRQKMSDLIRAETQALQNKINDATPQSGNQGR